MVAYTYAYSGVVLVGMFKNVNILFIISLKNVKKVSRLCEKCNNLKGFENLKDLIPNVISEESFSYEFGIVARNYALESEI